MILTAQDVRIGNILKTVNKTAKNYWSDSCNIILDEKRFSQLLIVDEIRLNLDGVELTPRILQLIGFECEPTYPFNAKSDINYYHFTYMRRYIKITFIWNIKLEHFVNTPFLYRKDKYYVHEIQNLIFALSGQELKLLTDVKLL